VLPAMCLVQAVDAVKLMAEGIRSAWKHEPTTW
jgi:hypothetical protein